MGVFLFSGTTALPAQAIPPETPSLPSYAVTLTAYNAVPEQTDGDPLVTASGAYSNPEIVAARSRDLADKLPFGTIIEIIGPSTPQNNCGYDIVRPIVGYRVIADAMSPRYTDRIDILFSTESNYTRADGGVKNAGNVLGICTDTSIRVVGYIDLTRPGTMPKTQAELARRVAGNGGIALK